MSLKEIHQIHRREDPASRPSATSARWARCTVEGIGIVIAYLSVVTVLVYPLFRAI